MKLHNKITKFQEGGAMPPQGAPQGAPAGPEGAAPGAPAEGGQDPVAQLVQMAQEALQSDNCEAALAVCDGLLTMLSQGQGGGAAPAEQGAPVYQKGGKIVRRLK